MRELSLMLIGMTAGALPAQAFDCERASTMVEKEICSDPDLKAIDANMASVYDSVRRTSSSAERKALVQSQRKWIAEREEQCSGPDGSACIRDKTGERIRLLLAQPLSSPGAPQKMHPFFIQQDGGERLYNVDYALIRFVEESTAATQVFNQEVKKLADMAPLTPVEDDLRPGVLLSSEMSMEISFASPRLISAAVNHYSYDGGAHGNGGIHNINVDVLNGKLLAIESLFGEAQVMELFRSCRAQILVQKAERSDGAKYDAADDPNYQESTISEHISQMDRWTFTEKGAVVRFDQYAIGAYVEGPFDCEFSANTLRRLALPNSTLP